MSTQEPADASADFSLADLKVLRRRDIKAIDEALRKVGPFGEVRLVIAEGRLRYVRTLRSEALDNQNPPSPA